MHDSNMAQPWRYLVEISEPFTADGRLKIVKTRNLASGMRQVGDEPACDGIGDPIGMERVAFSVADTTEFVEARITSGARLTISSAMWRMRSSLSL